ncbi:MAG: tRNA pseudouridine(55) synthase TruB [Actinomycetia bacterium]|nr:tRNA pseudouridine(55) synthase TruB [Actinomycetes bacterium]
MSRGGRRGNDSGVSGCLVIDKPAGCTSHDVVDQVRRQLKTRKVGHAGTLDPDATGVLVLGVGSGTKLLQFVTGADKSYIGELQFGSETSTLDASGEVTATYEMDPTPAQVSQAAATFVGQIEQIPPMVSAVKVGGKRLHELAREGQVVEREPRPATIDRFDVSPTDDPLVYELAVDCSSGTYIRTLVADLGTTLGGGAHLKSLRRTAVGPFTLDDSCPVNDLNLQDLVELVRGMAIIDVDEVIAEQVRNGRSLGSAPGSGRLVVRGPGGTLLAVYEARDGELRPVKVLATTGRA